MFRKDGIGQIACDHVASGNIIKLHQTEKKRVQMRCSRLETYVYILKVLYQKGPLKLPQLMNNTNISSVILSDHIAFLEQERLVAAHEIRKNCAVFEITQRGIKVLMFFRKNQ